MREQNIARVEAVRLTKELRREKEESRFWFNFSFAMVMLVAASTGAMLAIAQAAEMF